MPPTLYDRLGPERLDQLVTAFYRNVQADPVIAPLFPADIAPVREKQRLFLTQFLGGPPLYNQTHGHPRMRMRHFPHAIDETAVRHWLQCMWGAIDTLDIDADFKKGLFAAFPRLAVHMQNR